MPSKKHGGITENAVMDEINLAYRLEDGMKIHIPSKQEKEEKEVENKTNDLDNEYVTTSSGVSKEIENTTNAKVNINTATQTQLETLPGIGPSTAIKIITHRKENGRFNEISDIQQVSGIGEAKFEKIKELICVNETKN